MAKLVTITGKALSGEWGIEDESGTGIPVLRTTNFTNEGVIDYNDVVTRMITKKNVDEKFLQVGDIIIEKSGGSDKYPVGRVVYFEGSEMKYLFNNFTGLLRVKDKQKWFPKYIFYALYNNYFCGGTRKYENKTTGLHNLKIDDYIKSFEVKEENISRQNEICNNLDKVKTILDLRRQQVEKLDELIKSRFVEMFGDPIQNSKQFETIIGENFFKLSNGKTIPAEKRKQTGIPAYGGNGISWYTDDVLFEKDTLVVGRVGFQSGNVHLVYGPLWITDNAMYISKFHVDEYDLTFLCALMEHINFTRFQDAGDLKKITQNPFMQMEYIFPPIEMQHRYSNFVHYINKLKVVIQNSLSQTQLLFDSLMQEYFG